MNAAHLRDADVLRLANRLVEIKTNAYRQTLLETLRRHVPGRQRVMLLSQPIRNAIEEESLAHARMAVQTFNRMIDRWAQAHAGLDRETFARRLGEFARQRAETRGKVVGEMAPLTARLDAAVAFYRENGVEPEFDFTGPPAKCDLCKLLKANGPWPIERVMEVGYPHLNCTHSWRASTRAIEALKEGGMFPGRISAGQGPPAGILGSEAMISRLGNLDVAIGSLTGEGVEA